MPEEKAIPKNITLYPQDWTIVQDVARPGGMSISQAIRSIIRDWKRMKDEVRPVPDLGPDLEVDHGN